MKIIDRYLVRETLPPFFLALGLFTFLLAVKPMLEQAERLLAKGVDVPTVVFLLLTLLPQALGVTIPMAFMAGLLMALGRLSGDREAVAFLACGVSPLRLLRPALMLALVAGAADMYLLVKLVPESNQQFRVVTARLLAQMGADDIQPGLWYEGFPQKVIRVRGNHPGGGWDGVLMADTSQPGRPAITLAREGFLELDDVRREAVMVLPGESQRYLPGEEEGVYDHARASDLRIRISGESVFGTGDIMPSRGAAEMTIADLRRVEGEKVAAGVSPHPEIIHRHQMFSFPVACLVFAIIGVALGLHTRKEGKLGGFTLGLGVVVLYYGVMTVFEDLTKGGDFPAHWARWMPNLIVGLVGIVALRARMRHLGRDFSVALPAWMTFWRRRASSSVPVATVAGTGRARVVLVVRIPDIRLPTVRILDRYVARRYVNVSTLSFCGLLGLYYIGTLVDKSERLFKGQATTAMLLEYFYYSTPQFIAYVAPMAVLVAVLATVGGLTRTGELVVMRACGVSLYRVAFPLIVLSLVWSGGLFLLNDRVLAHANRRAETLEDRIRGNPPHTVNTIANANWLAGRDNRVYYYSAFDTRDQTLFGLSIFELDADGLSMRRHTFVSRAAFRDGTWHGEAGWSQDFTSGNGASRQVFDRTTLELVAPENFSGMHNQQVDLMTYGDLRAHVDELDASGFNLADSRVKLAQRIAFPFVTLVMTILGVPFGVTTGRRGTLYGVGLAIVLGAGYWILDTFFVAVGQADLLAPMLAAWAANLLFLALAVYAVLTVRT